MINKDSKEVRDEIAGDEIWDPQAGSGLQSNLVSLDRAVEKWSQ